MPYSATSDVLALWRKLQSTEWRDYLNRGGKGVFSIPGHKNAAKLKKIIEKRFSGKCLDIGCGCLAKPSYMAGGLEWVGIDPFECDTYATFERHVGMAEDLPFDDESFDNVLFASSIDHLVNPTLGLREANRVLRPGGCILVWFSRRGGAQYNKWLKRKKAQRYNDHHQWAFTDATMTSLVKNAGFFVTGITKFDFKSHVLIGEK